MLPATYVEKVYAGFMGKCVGVRLGAPIESVIWTFERIQAVYGDWKGGYLRPYRDFGADDDINGPAYYFLPLNELGDPTVADFGRAWIDYAREGKGFFWWGGVGVSTSHTVYSLLKHGEKLPIAREVLKCGKDTSDSIGGQIFIDSIGFCLPGQPERAAELGGRLASVAHYDESVYGGRFMAAAVAAAFTAGSVDEVIDTALLTIPKDCEYAQVTAAVRAFHRAHPEDWRLCREMLGREWGYGLYTGVCPMIPNAGVCILALCYGGGDFNRTVEIATFCGWDTDCNAGNVGAILGILRGIEGIADHYLLPYHDTAILSGVSGTLNTCDMPSLAREMALRGYQLAGETPPASLLVNPKDLFFDFELPRSTHGFRVSDPFVLQIENREDRPFSGKRSLSVLFNRLQKGNASKLFFKPFYTRADFEDGRYSPVFSPKVCPGQVLSMQLYREQWTGTLPITVTPYVREAFTNREIRGDIVTPANDAWTEIRFTVPDVDGGVIDEVGLVVESHSINTADFESRDLGRLFLDDVRVTGNAQYALDFAKAREEFGCLTPFSFNRGEWKRDEASITASCAESTQAFTGNYYTRDVAVTCDTTPNGSDGACLLLRGLGTVRHVFAGLLPGGQAGILLGGDGGYAPLAACDFLWEPGKRYNLTAIAQGDSVQLLIDGVPIISVNGIPYAHGMVGMGLPYGGSAAFANMRIEERDEA